jgi:hypothetical protein
MLCMSDSIAGATLAIMGKAMTTVARGVDTRKRNAMQNHAMHPILSGNQTAGNSKGWVPFQLAICTATPVAGSREVRASFIYH